MNKLRRNLLDLDLIRRALIVPSTFRENAAQQRCLNKLTNTCLLFHCEEEAETSSES